MSLKLRNTWNYLSDDRWEWAAFIDDGGSGELADVEFVEYVLHETFSKPIRRVHTRENGFRLDTKGWGTFELRAFVHLKNGKKLGLTHEIQLEYEPKTGTST
jgi:transcription initiation factor IIF auxiliary subunit